MYSQLIQTPQTQTPNPNPTNPLHQGVLHAQGEVHAAELLGAPAPDPRRLPPRRGTCVLRGQCIGAALGLWVGVRGFFPPHIHTPRIVSTLTTHHHNTNTQTPTPTPTGRAPLLRRPHERPLRQGPPLCPSVCLAVCARPFRQLSLHPSTHSPALPPPSLSPP